MADVPTHRLRVIDLDQIDEEILQFAKGLEAEGERPWFEVRYPSPPGLSPEESEEWQRKQEDHFDAVEVVNGEIVPLPPYTALRGESEYAPEAGFGQ